jgi:benzylsuccinate CoA-transferase BbsF subunit
VSDQPLPLAGIRVLDFTHVLAGPMCTRLLTDLGADVLRVESTKHPDTPWRSTSDDDLGRSYAYVMVHRGKRSITLDLKSETGNAVARRLGLVADVIVENFSASVMPRLKLDYDSLAGENPRLVFVSMSGYGHDGPRSDWTSMNSNLQAYSGLMMATETDEQPPVAISNSWMDYIGGLHGAYAVLDRLAERVKTGRGAYVDLAQFECGVGSLGSLLLAGIVDGELPARPGNRSNGAAPQGCYPCEGEDQWCAISIEDDEQWHALGMAIDNPRWSADPRFASLVGRLRHHEEIDRGLNDWTRTQPPDEVEHRLTVAGIRAAKMRRMDDVLENPDRQTAFRFIDGGNAPILHTVLPFGFAPRDEPAFAAAPRLGEHTDEGLRDWLGLDVAEIARLHETGALV